MSPSKKQVSSIPHLKSLRLQGNRPPSVSTRERIINYLQEHHTTTTVELSQAWGLTRADIRYHLNQLLSQKIIEHVPFQPDPLAGRGRPIIRYRLAEAASRNPVNRLCRVLISLLMASQPPGDHLIILHSIANQLSSQISGQKSDRRSPQPLPMTQKLNQAMDDLNLAGYASRWEAHAQGPRIVFRRCPYSTILAGTPEICQIDQLILEKILLTPVRQISRMNLETGIPQACVFEMTAPSQIVMLRNA